jgi:hypothetical protein
MASAGFRLSRWGMRLRNYIVHFMTVVKKEASGKNHARGTVSDKVRSHADDPFFVKKNEEAKEALSKMDLSILKEKR